MNKKSFIAPVIVIFLAVVLIFVYNTYRDKGVEDSFADQAFNRRGSENGFPGKEFVGERIPQLNDHTECTKFVRGTDGDDLRDGTTELKAWKTITKANVSAVEGDVICIGPSAEEEGYFEQINPQVDNVSYVGNPGATFTGVKIVGFPEDCASEECTNGSGNYVVYIAEREGITIEDLLISINDSNRLDEDSATRGYSLIYVDNGSKNIIVRDNLLIGAEGLEELTSNVYVSGIRISKHAEDVLVHNNFFSFLTFDAVLVEEAGAGVSISHNTFGDIIGSAVSVRSRTGVLNPKKLQINNNEVYNINDSHAIDFDIDAGSTSNTDYARYIDIHTNSFINILKSAINLDYVENVLIEKNYFSMIRNKDDISCDPVTNCLSKTVQVETEGTVENVIIRENTFNFNAGGLDDLGKGYRVYNNTFYENNEVNFGPTNEEFNSVLKITGGSNKVVNNAMVGQIGRSITLLSSDDSGIGIDYNLYWSSDKVFFARHLESCTEVPCESFTQWQSTFDKNSIEVWDDEVANNLFKGLDPGYKGFGVLIPPANYLPFEPKENSELIDNGTNLTTIIAVQGKEVSVEDPYFFSNFGEYSGDYVAFSGENYYQEVTIALINYQEGKILLVDEVAGLKEGMKVSLPFSGNAPDIGSYEYIEEISPTIIPSTESTIVVNPTLIGIECGPSDVNGDENFTIIDFDAFADMYDYGTNKCGDTPILDSACGGKDVNNDYILNIQDFVSFALRYNDPTCSLNKIATPTQTPVEPIEEPILDATVIPSPVVTIEPIIITTIPPELSTSSLTCKYAPDSIGCWDCTNNGIPSSTAEASTICSVCELMYDGWEKLGKPEYRGNLPDHCK